MLTTDPNLPSDLGDAACAVGDATDASRGDAPCSTTELRPVRGPSRDTSILGDATAATEGDVTGVSPAVGEEVLLGTRDTLVVREPSRDTPVSIGDETSVDLVKGPSGMRGDSCGIALRKVGEVAAGNDGSADAILKPTPKGCFQTI